MKEITHIMLVDDDEIHNFITRRFLTKELPSIKLTQCLNGKLAIDKLKEFEEGELPDLLLLDINMHVLGAFGFLEIISKNDALNNLNIIIHSTSIRNEDKIKLLAYQHVKDYVPKPLTSESFQEILKKIFSN